MITARDMQVVEFLKEYKAASTATLAKIFYPSLRVCQNRLNELAKAKQVSRIRRGVNTEYVYYIKAPPKQLKHKLLVTDFYRELSGKVDIVTFKPEPELSSLRPDAVFGYRKQGKKELGLLEVEISNKGFDWGKYDRFITTGEYKKYFPVIPKLFIVSDKEIENKLLDMNVTIINTEFEGL